MQRRRHEGPSFVAGARRPSSLGLRHAATWGLVVLAALLLVDGAPWGRDPDASPVAVEDPVEAARPAVTAALIDHLRSRNGSLSGEEQRRVVEAVLRSSRRHALDPYLVTAVLLVESDARPWAQSGKGAIGLMQVMPHMAEKLPLAGNLATIESNIEAGCFILADNIRRLGEPQGISSYFWGRHVRGDAYLEKVERARARVRESSPS
ncbi:MAG: transglycosylase SLT domain-containing protein [Myxococcota bacterium]